MKKIFITLGIYIIFIISGISLFYSSINIRSHSSGCPGYNNNHSFLAEWFDITYFEEKEWYEACMKKTDIYGLYKNQNEKDISCRSKSGPNVCGEPNFKPGIIYGLIGICIFYIGIRLRKKFIIPYT